MAFDVYQEVDSTNLALLGRLYTPTELNALFGNSSQLQDLQSRVEALEEIHASGDFDTRLAQVNLDVTQVRISNTETSSKISQLTTFIGA